MTRVIERVAGRYDVREVELGEIYVWRPARVVIDCGCGERLTLTRSETTCVWCEADHTAVVREALSARQPEDDRVSHPWRYSRPSRGTRTPF